MSLFNPRKTDVKIIKHHRNSAVFKQGRYLVVEMKISTRSKRGREIARETAMAVLDEIGFSDDSLEDVVIEIAENMPPGGLLAENETDLSTASKEQG